MMAAMRPSLALACAAVVVGAVGIGCAAAQRESRLRRELDGHALARPLAEVWPVALRLLDERGFDLGSNDRVSIGKAPLGTAARLFSQARDTHARDGRWVAETDLDGSDVRYRIEGSDAGGGTSRVVFYRIAGSLEGRDDREFRDVELELELVRRVDPEAAARIADAARAR